MSELKTNLWCKKGKSTFNTRRSSNLDICVYHKKLNKKNIERSDLIDWLENGFICKSATNHIKALIYYLDGMD